jgi:hypothetical protein
VCARNAEPHKVAANRIQFVGERHILLLLVTSKRMFFCIRRRGRGPLATKAGHFDVGLAESVSYQSGDTVGMRSIKCGKPQSRQSFRFARQKSSKICNRPLLLKQEARMGARTVWIAKQTDAGQLQVFIAQFRAHGFIRLPVGRTGKCYQWK